MTNVSLTSRQLELAVHLGVPLFPNETGIGHVEIDGLSYVITRTRTAGETSFAVSCCFVHEGALNHAHNNVLPARIAHYEAILNGKCSDLPPGGIDPVDMKALIRSGLDFSKTNLHGYNIRKLDLSNAELSNAGLSDTDLNCGVLTGATPDEAESGTQRRSRVLDCLRLMEHMARMLPAEDLRNLGGVSRCWRFVVNKLCDQVVKADRALKAAIDSGGAVDIVAALRADNLSVDPNCLVRLKKFEDYEYEVPLVEVVLNQGEAEMADRLVARGAKLPSPVPPTDGNGCSVSNFQDLYVAMKGDPLVVLKKDVNGMTFAHYAARGEMTPMMVMYLLSSPHLDLSIRDKWGDSPLHVAAEWVGNVFDVARTIFPRMIRKANELGFGFATPGRDGETVLQRAVRARFESPYVKGKISAAAQVLQLATDPCKDALSSDGHTALHRALTARCWDEALLLLDAGADPECSKSTSQSASEYLDDLRKESIEELDQLLKALIAELDVKSKGGNLTGKEKQQHQAVVMKMKESAKNPEGRDPVQFPLSIKWVGEMKQRVMAQKGADPREVVCFMKTFRPHGTFVSTKGEVARPRLKNAQIRALKSDMSGEKL